MGVRVGVGSGSRPRGASLGFHVTGFYGLVFSVKRG